MQLPGLAKPMELKGKGEIQAHLPPPPPPAAVGCSDGETGTHQVTQTSPAKSSWKGLEHLKCLSWTFGSQKLHLMEIIWTPLLQTFTW